MVNSHSYRINQILLSIQKFKWLLVHGIGVKLVLNWEQNMLYTKSE